MNNIWRLSQKQAKQKEKDWLLKILAKNRGLQEEKKLQQFLNPSFSQIIALKLPDSQKSITRIKNAIKNKEKIIVYSDYDADGICASAIMWETLNDLGANVMPYVPHRIREGYGLSVSAIEELAKDKAKLIITVDHGVTAVDQVNAANKLGVDVIITDHHVLPEILPKSFALVHTTDLCGAGVAWRFCWDLIQALRPDYKEKLKDKLELAALATIADLVPLVGPNRAIVKIGLEKLSKTKRPGIKALLSASNIKGPIGTYEIGHILAPRINAMGRIEHGLDSLRLICARNQKQADELTKLLTKTNSKRQDLTQKAIDTAIKMVDSELVGVIANPDWHEGVIGLVASRLVEAHHKPMIVIAKGEKFSKGSARSIPGFNIIEAIRNSSDLLKDAGGHPMAAGFTIETKNIETFTKKINAYAANKITNELLTPVINIECLLNAEDLSLEILETIKLFEPYGIANPQPIFLSKNLLVEDIRGVGQDNRHLKLIVSGHGAIGFNHGEKRSSIRPGYSIDMVYTLEKDNYNGNNKLQLKIKDLIVNS